MNLNTDNLGTQKHMETAPAYSLGKANPVGTFKGKTEYFLMYKGEPWIYLNKLSYHTVYNLLKIINNGFEKGSDIFTSDTTLEASYRNATSTVHKQLNYITSLYIHLYELSNWKRKIILKLMPAVFIKEYTDYATSRKKEEEIEFSYPEYEDGDW